MAESQNNYAKQKKPAEPSQALHIKNSTYIQLQKVQIMYSVSRSTTARRQGVRGGQGNMKEYEETFMVIHSSSV
jgi:hypothetical protein